MASTGGYSSFGDVIKSTLGLNNFTAQLNPWLISAPYPFAPQQQSGQLTISNSSEEICSQLQQLQTAKDQYNSSHSTSLSLFAYLGQQYGSAMTLSIEELSLLENSCSQCRFLLARDLTLPVFMSPGAKGCIVPAEFNAAKADLQSRFGSSGLATTDANYSIIITNFLNQRWGFMLSSDDYADYESQLATSPDKTLCNLNGSAAQIAADPAAWIGSQVAVAVTNGQREYVGYIDLQKDAFRSSYVTTCSAAGANLKLYAPQKIYHFTLYYYDQADNLVKTIPPEGVVLLNESDFPAVQNYRDKFSAISASSNYDHTLVHTDKNEAMTALGGTLGAGAGRTIELWLNNPAKNGNRIVVTTPDHRYLFQVCLVGNRMSTDVYRLDTVGAAKNAIHVQAARHYTTDISSQLPFREWQHIVLSSNDFVGDSIMSAYLNGQLLTGVPGNPYAGCGLNIAGGDTTVNVPDDLATLKHLRVYDRIFSAGEVTTNADNPYFLPSNYTGVYWFRTNVPGDPVNTEELAIKPVFPAHRMATSYTYNSTNQVSRQQSPDGGVNRYYYDLLSRLVISQNDKQLAADDYSYTVYEPLGKITEVGQKKQTSVDLGNPDYIDDATQSSFLASGTNSQITNTYYDVVAPSGNGIQSVVQDNLRKRVAASTYRDLASGLVQQASYYNYDLDGNVKTLYQQVTGLDLKRIDYEYDLISGKVNFVSYQKNQPDQFYYDYKYDAENRLREAWTSPLASLSSYGRGSVLDPVKKRMDASYQYYLHGPLARYELGDINAKVQGIDYAYTLQGWLKGVNRTVFRFRPNESTDMGNDGTNGVPADAMNFNMYYYAGDFKPIGGVNPFDKVLEEENSDFYPLYNGNIAGMAQTLPAIQQASMVNSYRYDQLNRLKVNQPHQNNLPYSLPEYDTMDEFFTYDGNGNIITSFRHGDFFADAKDMDDLTYRYNRDANGNLINNRLTHVNDVLPFYASGNPFDLHDQAANNYTYDPIGNLTADQQGGISGIDWSVYGKIKSITKTDGPSISYKYDPLGHRASKTVNGLTTWYIRDAQGNTMAVYDNKNSAVNWREQNLYGSSRLGVWAPDVNLETNNAAAVWDTIGHKQYELSNHLGNVLVTLDIPLMLTPLRQSKVTPLS